METILEVKHISKIYGLETSHPFKAINDISFTVNTGDFICIMGPSGSGKSTLLNNITTIDIPTKGEVYINGIEVKQMSQSKLSQFRSENIGFIFQADNLLDSLTVFENMALPLELKGIDTKIIKTKVEFLAKNLQIEKELDKYPQDCSGGQRQRIAIARSLISEPDLIVADEPTGNLDSKNSHEILKLLKRLNQVEKKTIIMVSHDSLMAAYASKVMFLKDGKIEKIIDSKKYSSKEYFYAIMSMNFKEAQILFE